MTDHEELFGLLLPELQIFVIRWHDGEDLEVWWVAAHSVDEAANIWLRYMFDRQQQARDEAAEAGDDEPNTYWNFEDDRYHVFVSRLPPSPTVAGVLPQPDDVLFTVGQLRARLKDQEGDAT